MHDEVQETLVANRRRLAATVKRLREERGLTQEAAADRIRERTGYKYDHKHLSLVERAEVNITLKLLTLIAIGLAVDVSRLLEPALEPQVSAATYDVSERDLQQVERWIASVRGRRIPSTTERE